MPGMTLKSLSYSFDDILRIAQLPDPINCATLDEARHIQTAKTQLAQHTAHRQAGRRWGHLTHTKYQLEIRRQSWLDTITEHEFLATQGKGWPVNLNQP